MPSFDAAYCKLKSHDMSYNPDFTPEQSVKSVLFSAPRDAQYLTAVVPPWHAPEWYMRRLMKKENDLGRAALCLMVDDNILSANFQRTLESFAVVADRYYEECVNLGQAPNKWMAASLGTSVLMHTLSAYTFPPPSHLKFIAPGGNLATSLWRGRRTQPLRSQFEEQGVMLPRLVDAWRPLEPTYLASSVSGTKVDMSVSLADDVIPHDTAFEFAAALEQNGNRVSIDLNKFKGHYGTMLSAIA